MTSKQVQAFFAGRAKEHSLFQAIEQIINSMGSVTVSVSKSQISFGTKTKFAWIWMPQPWAKRPENSVVLTFGLGRKIEDQQIDEAVEPYPGRWTHHVIIHDESDITDQVRQWLEEAYTFSQERRRSSISGKLE